MVVIMKCLINIFTIKLYLSNSESNIVKHAMKVWYFGGILNVMNVNSGEVVIKAFYITEGSF